MSTSSHSIPLPEEAARALESAPPAAANAGGSSAEAALQPSRTGLMLLLLLLGAAFLGWYLYGKRPPAHVPTPLPPVFVLSPLQRSLPAPADEAPLPSAAARPLAQAPAPAPAVEAAPPAPDAPRTAQARPLVELNAQPRYPLAALRRGESGTVVLRVNVGADGVPDEVAVARRSGSRELDRAALVAVRDWRFQPALHEGREVASVVEQAVEFRSVQ